MVASQAHVCRHPMAIDTSGDPCRSRSAIRNRECENAATTQAEIVPGRTHKPDIPKPIGGIGE